VSGRTYLYAISLGAHAALGAALLAVPARVRHEIIAISMSETRPKPKSAPRVEPTPPPELAKTAAHPVRAKAAPPAAKPIDVAPATAPPATTDAVPDFGLSLSNAGGAGGGLAVPSGRAAAPLAVAAPVKTLSRTTHAPADCDEPPAKPTLVSRPTPAYTDDARAAGISGKVRVEITVDEQGRVVAVRVLQGLGYGLDEAAVAAARGMIFEPAVRCGRPAPATFKVGFHFSPGTP
jgi:protein TonB